MRTDFGIRVLVILLLVLACKADWSYTGKRSWDIILSEEELGATLDRTRSIDCDYTSGQNG